LSHIGLVSGNKGKGGWHHTDEQRKLMSQRRTGILLSEETKHKISLMHKGKKLTDEHKRKIGLTSLGRTWQMTDEQKEICRLNNMGEKNPNWQGGISFEPYDKNFNCCLKKQIAERDLYTCQICGEILPKGFAIHHIDYNKKNSNSSNLVFLCKHCHVKKTNYNRRYWIQYFTIKQNNIKVKYELQDKFDEQKGALKKWL
jgi:5-methylcytosine-specific restriction endonuclease McrA